MQGKAAGQVTFVEIDNFEWEKFNVTNESGFILDAVVFNIKQECTSKRKKVSLRLNGGLVLYV